MFAAADIAAGVVVESSPCMLVPALQYEQHARYTVLEHYLFR